MKLTLAEIANIVEGEVVGDADIIITGLNGIQEAGEGDITFLADQKFFSQAKDSKASALIVSRDMEILGKPTIRTDHPSLAFSKLINNFSETSVVYPKGVHSTACISDKSVIGEGVSIGPGVVIDDDVVIGDETIIAAGCYIGVKTAIGKNCLIYPNVTIYHCTSIDQNVCIHSGTVIGSDGFGYVTENGKHKKIPQIGHVVIEENVEIGANVTIDRARFNETRIGRGTKIDNLVQVGHNACLGEDCLILAHVGISGSVNIGKGAILAGQSGVAGHITIGEGAILTAKTGATKDIKPRTKVTGFPARLFSEEMRIKAHLRKLPKALKELKTLQNKIQKIEETLKNVCETKNS